MKKAVSVVMVLALVVVFAHVALAQGSDAAAKTVKKAGPKPGGFVVEAVSATATVHAVDAAARTVSLKLPDGATREYKVDKAVRKPGPGKGRRPGQNYVCRISSTLR